ncbi:MAG TPA: serine hydrolase domain-containing protein [Gemmatimonadales bacterium]|nr:serine hydrolase domain-containing protein [Gemmatimonadales bacterium]
MRIKAGLKCGAAIMLLVATHPAGAVAQATLPAATRAAIDSAALEALARTGAPSASIAVVRQGQIAYLQAYGNAQLDPVVPATTDMRYSIGSISKQFTATAVLLLVQRGKLSLDDKVSRWLPELTRANDVTVRQLLSMTSGYQDYWPQDYVMPPMLQPTTPRAIVDQWARKPLDFEPGTRWQYSNTNYVIAGMIVEKVAGMPLVDFLRKEIFDPLNLKSVAIIDGNALGPHDAQRYRRFALGPARPAPKEGAGWLFAMAELAMTPADLARWDISVIDQSILSPASYHTQQTEVLLADGVATGYGFGVDVGMSNGHRVISHSGEVSGFTAQNSIYPDDSTAVVVLVNMDATGAPGMLAGRITGILFGQADDATRAATARARQIFEGLQHGTIDRSLFSDNANAYFSDQALADFAQSLGPLGAATEFTQTRQSLRGGMTYRGYRIRCGEHTLSLSTFTLPNGKLEQYQVSP